MVVQFSYLFWFILPINFSVTGLWSVRKLWWRCEQRLDDAWRWRSCWSQRIWERLEGTVLVNTKMYLNAVISDVSHIAC